MLSNNCMRDPRSVSLAVREFPNCMHFLDKAPRAPSRKIRKYEHVDLTKEFEIRSERREKAKKEKLEELYERHD